MSALAELQSRIQGTDALIAQYESAVAGSEGKAPPSLFANIRALEKLKKRLEVEFLEVASQIELEVYRYRILNESDRVTLGMVSEAWGKFQDLFSSVYAALPKPKPQEKKRGKTPALELGYGYSYAGSVGVVVTVPKDTGIYATSPIEEASSTVFNMIEAKNLDEIARTIGPAPIRALYDWIDVHVKNQAGIGLEWRTQQDVKRDVFVDYQTLANIQATIADTTTRASVDVDGELFAVDAQAKEFKIKGDNGQEYSGTFETAITADHAASVPARYSARIIETTKVIHLKKERETTLFLESLKPL